MTAPEIVKAIAKEEHKSITGLSTELGYPYASGLNNTLRKTPNLGVETLLNILNHLDYEIVIKPKKRGMQSYTVTMSEKE